MLLSTLTIILALTSAVFMAVTLFVFYKYIKSYRLPREQYYLLLGFIHLKWIAWMYISFTVILGVWTAFIFLNK